MIIQDDRFVVLDIDCVILPVGSPWGMVRCEDGPVQLQRQVRVEDGFQKRITIKVIGEEEALGKECGNYKVLVPKWLCTVAQALSHTHGGTDHDLMDRGDAKASGNKQALHSCGVVLLAILHPVHPCAAGEIKEITVLPIDHNTDRA